tara:strand:- start:1004 stop:1597 length:594 start_codon:yes stop_codon:yes gene_type:complete
MNQEQTLLVEQNFITYNNDIIKEARDISKTLVLRNVVLQRANAKNQNGRVYPREILMKEVSRYRKEFVQENRALGELDHPESPIVNLRNVCANVTRIDVKGDDVVGDMQILSTPSGNIVRELVKNNIRLGVSSRGVGSVKSMDENTLEVQDDYNLICFDVVSNPSTHGAFINESLSSSSQFLINIDTLVYDFLAEIR